MKYNTLKSSNDLYNILSANIHKGDDILKLDMILRHIETGIELPAELIINMSVTDEVSQEGYDLFRKKYKVLEAIEAQFLDTCEENDWSRYKFIPHESSILINDLFKSIEVKLSIDKTLHRTDGE